MRVGYLPNLTHSVALLGLDEGRFQRALGPSARVEAKEFVAGTEMVTAIAAGELDLAYLGPGPAIKAFTQGVKIRLLAGAASGGSVLLARPGAVIRSARDLSRLRVTVPRYGNTQDVILRGFLDQAGIQDTAHGGPVEVLQADSPDLAMLFAHRQIDAAAVPEPWGARLEERKAADVALTEAQMLGGVTMPSALLVASARFIDRRPDWTRAWVATHRALVREINADPAAMAARVNESLKRRTGKALKPAVLRRAWSRLTITDQVDDRRLAEFAAMMRRIGYLRVPFDPAAFRHETQPTGSAKIPRVRQQSLFVAKARKKRKREYYREELARMAALLGKRLPSSHSLSRFRSFRAFAAESFAGSFFRCARTRLASEYGNLYPQPEQGVWT